jgi:hypothetical protein
MFKVLHILEEIEFNPQNLQHNPSMFFLSNYLKEIEANIHMFTDILLIIAKNCKQTTYPPMSE